MKRTHGTENTAEEDGKFEKAHRSTGYAVQATQMEILKHPGKNVCSKSEHYRGYYPKNKKCHNAGDHVALTAVYRKIGPERGIAGDRDEESDKEAYTRGYFFDQPIPPSTEKSPRGNYKYKDVYHSIEEL